MLIRYALFALLLMIPFAVPSTASAREANLSRREIREMPIVQRPNRVGHFYGNAVRRGYYRRADGMTAGTTP